MDAAMENNALPYMEELQKCITHFHGEFLSRLLPTSSSAISIGTETICTSLVRSMASRVLIIFIRHASLVRPLSESGKLKMARDMAELELAVGQKLFPVEQLGAPYQALRSLRPVIFLEASQFGASPLLQDLPPVSYFIIFILGYQKNCSKATLDDYAVQVRARGHKGVQCCISFYAAAGVIFIRKNTASHKPLTNFYLVV